MGEPVAARSVYPEFRLDRGLSAEGERKKRAANLHVNEAQGAR